MLNIILGLLPLFAFILFYVFFSTANAGRCRCPQRTAFIHASLALGMVIFLSTELFSALEMLRKPVIVATWYGVIVVLALAIVLQRRHRLIPLFSLPAINRFEWVMAGALAGIFIVEALIALASPPNTWDSMTYHMSRVMHWIQNGSIAFYPANSLRQLYLAPGAEMAIMQLVMLAESDRLVNLMQLFCMAGSVIGVSLITCELGGARRVQIFAAIFAATIPMAILQSTSTQNDLAESFWIVCFALFLLRLRVTRSWTNTASAGAALGFSLLTKGTALLFIPSFLFFAVAAELFFRKPQSTRPSVRLSAQPIRFKPQLPPIVVLLCIVVIGTAIFTPHACRTRAFFGTLANPNQTGSSDFRVANEQITGSIFIANIVRNCSMHLGTPSKKINRFLDSRIYALLGKEVDNPHSTWINSPFHVRPSLHENEAGNPLHFGAIVIAFALLFSVKRYRRFQPLPVYAGAIVASFLLFCLLLKWQPFHTRLHLPLFVCAAPVVAIVFRHLLTKPFRSFILVLFIFGALPWVVFNAGRPLIGKNSVLTVPRNDQYFVNRPDLKEPFLKITDEVRKQNPGTVGLALSEDDWEYPLWVLLEEQTGNNLKIGNVLVENKSQNLQQQPFLPDLIISTRREREAVIGTRTYGTISSYGALSILAPQERSSQQ